MVAAFLTQICIALIILVLMLFIQGKRLFDHKVLLVIFIAVYFLDNFLIVLTNHFANLQLIPNHVWEGFLVCSWSGKLYSIIMVLILLFALRKILTTIDIGVTFQQNPGSILPALLVILALAGWAFLVGVSSPKGQPDLQTLFYLAIMPGLNEELVYRGYLLGILNKVIPRRLTLLGAPLGWGLVLTSVLFGLLHGFWLDKDLAFHIDIVALRNATMSGLIFAWLRERTGSLLAPVIAHGVEDFLFFLPRMV